MLSKVLVAVPVKVLLLQAAQLAPGFREAWGPHSHPGLEGLDGSRASRSQLVRRRRLSGRWRTAALPGSLPGSWLSRRNKHASSVEPKTSGPLPGEPYTCVKLQY